MRGGEGGEREGGGREGGREGGWVKKVRETKEYREKRGRSSGPLTFISVCSEFFHLLSLEFVNANFALFQCLHGRYKPSSHSSTHEHHLYYFKFFGKILAKAICDGKWWKRTTRLSRCFVNCCCCCCCFSIDS